MATLRGFKDISKALRDYQKETIQEVREIVADNGSDLLLRAQRSLDGHSNSGFNFIQLSAYSPVSSKGLSVVVGVTSVGSKGLGWLPAWIEFGTGIEAKKLLAGSEYTDEIRTLAMQFFVTGKGTMKPSPYLFNNYPIVKDNFTKELNAFLKTRK